MKRSLWITAIASVLAVAALQNSNPQPGRNRPDAPAQFEIGRRSITTEANTNRFMNPTEAEPEPPPDSRITAELTKWHRGAIPFNLLYLPGRAEPQVLPEILTPDIVLTALSN